MYISLHVAEVTMMIHSYMDKYPTINDTAFIAKIVRIIGEATIDEDVNISVQTVIRDDVAPTRISKRVSVQDLTMIHQSPDSPIIIEDDVTIGHQVLLHGCIIRKNALI